jgi:hypothetical protein
MGNEELTITLTGRPPVRIRKAEWPIVAQAVWHDGQVPTEWTRRHRLTVRQHEDGRAIAYGVCESLLPHERDRRGGELVDAGGDVAAAVYRVAEHLEVDRWLAEECIADLPAMEL